MDNSISEAAKILTDPGFFEQQSILRHRETVSLPVSSKRITFAEKFRAALTRRDVAIRDFYDIDYASQKLDLHIDDREFIRLVKKKLSVPEIFRWIFPNRVWTSFANSLKCS